MALKRRQWASLLLAGVMAATALFPSAAPAHAAAKADAKKTIPATAATENFYRHVNRSWLNTTQIPSSSSSVGSFVSLDDAVKRDLRRLLEKGLKSGADKGNDSVANMLKIYRMYQDTERRDAEGLKPITAHIKKIEAIKTIADLEKQVVDLPISTLFTFSVSTDFLDSNRYIIAFSSGMTTLPDKSFYDTQTETGKTYVKALRAFYEKLLTLAGNPTAKAKSIAADAIAIETLIADNTLTMEEASDMANLYTPTSLAKLDAQVKCFDIQGMVKSYAGELKPSATELINVSTPQYYMALDAIVTEKNLPKLKNYMLVQLLAQKSDILTTDMLRAYEAFMQTISGASSPLTIQERAFYYATGLYPFSAGKLYTDAYFSESAKNDVTTIAKNIIAVYEKRIRALPWMSAATKKQALKKLDTLGFKIGFPEPSDVFDPLKGYTVDATEKGMSLSATIDAMAAHAVPIYFARLDKPVDKRTWEMSPQTVNAYYNPMNNEIVFPAAVLQAPFYSPKQNASANYGAIGTIIGHEISHAFDKNGSTFDEKGNMKNWWTDADTAAYDKLAKALVAQYNATTIDGHTINGAMTMNENIADLGGVASALQAAQSLRNFDAKAFFSSYATIWRSKQTEELNELAARVDVHAPNEARVNVVLRNIDLFHTTYKTKAGDSMYLEKSKRIVIW